MTRRRRRLATEGGQVLVVFALLSILLFSVAGLAVDTGHGYISQRASQSAGDTAAIAGAGMLGTTLRSQPPSTGGACDVTGVVQQALNTAALNGQLTAAATLGCAGASGTYCGTTSSSQYDYTFYSGTVTCGSASATTAVEITIPPVPALGADCSVQSGAEFNCIQLSITSRIRNYVEGVIGIPSTTVHTVSTAFARVSPGAVRLPDPNAVTLWKQDGAAKAPDWAGGYIPCVAKGATSVSGEATAGGAAIATQVITGLGAGWPIRPSLDTCAQAAVYGVDGSAAAYSPYNGADWQTLIGEGSLAFGAETILCDPYGGKRCPSPGIPSPDGNGTVVCGTAPYTGACGAYSVGARGFALPVTGNTYCSTYADTTSSPLGLQNATHPCQTRLGRVAFPGQLDANWSADTGWTQKTMAAPNVAGLDSSCSGGIVLNGSAIPSACRQTAGDPYTLRPGAYRYIVINHGTYTLGSGLYSITGAAPIDTSSGTTAATAGIDLSGESAKDVDLCPTASAPGVVPAGCLSSIAAGVWIGSGAKAATGTAQPASTCAGAPTPSATDTNVQGSGVSFFFGPNAGGFISTHEVTGVTLSAPSISSSYRTAGEPLLFYLSGAGTSLGTTGGAGGQPYQWVHLDARSDESAPTTSGFQGIVYQAPTAQNGGVELASNIGKHNAPVLTGQVLARTLLTYGDDSGIAVDFRAGWGQEFNQVPTSSTSTENTLVATASHAARSGGPPAVGATTWVQVNLADESPLNAYDIWVSIDDGPPVYFSSALWDVRPYPGVEPQSPPEPNTPVSDTATENPPAVHGGYPGVAVLSGNASSMTDSYGGLGSSMTLTDTASGNAYSSFMWGPGNVTGIPASNYTASLRYTFPDPGGAGLHATFYLVDGDGCPGDSSLVHIPFGTPTGQAALEQ